MANTLFDEIRDYLNDKFLFEIINDETRHSIKYSTMQYLDSVGYEYDEVVVKSRDYNIDILIKPKKIIEKIKIVIGTDNSATFDGVING